MSRSTPENKVKRKVSNLIERYCPDAYIEMPVPGGYGKSGLDYVLCIGGRFVAIETKAPGKKPTARQKSTAGAIERSGGVAIWVDGSDERMDYLARFLASEARREPVQRCVPLTLTQF